MQRCFEARGTRQSPAGAPVVAAKGSVGEQQAQPRSRERTEQHKRLAEIAKDPHAHMHLACVSQRSIADAKNAWDVPLLRAPQSPGNKKQQVTVWPACHEQERKTGHTQLFLCEPTSCTCLRAAYMVQAQPALHDH